MRKSRKKIDIFLLELDKFIWRNEFDKRLIHNTFIITFKWNSKNIKNISTNYKDLDIPNLVKNIQTNRITFNWKNRTNVFIRKVAYWIEYKEVDDFDYDNIFWKIVFNETKEFIPRKVIKRHWKKINNKLIIPIEWYHDNCIYLY